MEYAEQKQLVADTGRRLLELGLVARTWGNISIKTGPSQFVISPSGLGYENMQADDVPLYDMDTGIWNGKRRPSSEKKIHEAAYKLYPTAGAAIHTHQDFATAVGLVGADGLKMTEEEKSLLGMISVARYALPGTQELADNVAEALNGSRVVLMAHHGVLIVGSDCDDAVCKAEVLEDVCRRAVLEKIGGDLPVHDFAGVRPFRAQLDDMAQMIGPRFSADIVSGLKAGLSPDDVRAMDLLVEKAVIAKKYSQACGVKGDLGFFECMRMRAVYKLKYSRQKNG